MVPNWKALVPHRPLEPDSPQYVASPAGDAGHIAAWIRADRSTVLVAGPVGIGKSTELAQAAGLLQTDRVACLVRLDRQEHPRHVTPDQVLLRIAGRLAALALEHLKLSLSPKLRTSLVRARVLDSAHLPVESEWFEGSASSLLRITLAEVADRSRQRRISLLLDGLEKMPPTQSTQDVFDALGGLPEDVDLITVVPWHIAFGPASDTILRTGEHLVALRAIEVDGMEGEPGRQFLKTLLARRLGLDGAPALQQHPHYAVFDEAARMSGGVPRTFLQLVADAATYARLRRGDLWPNHDDLDDAVTEQRHSFRRALQPGDTKEILNSIGHDGRELGIDRKIRLLSHGVLLERFRDGAPVLELHPLATPLVGKSSPHA